MYLSAGGAQPPDPCGTAGSGARPAGRVEI